MAGSSATKRFENRKARHKYRIEQEYEVGLCLIGSEVKALRQGRASLNESFALFKKRELFLLNFHIDSYSEASRQSQHAPTREKKLLMHKRELARLEGKVQRGGMTLVPLALFFNAGGRAKVTLGLAKGMSKVDRRQDIAERDWQRRKARLLRKGQTTL